jgi:hypothetical protein
MYHDGRELTQAEDLFKIIVEFTVGCGWDVFMEWTGAHGRSRVESEKTKSLMGDENEDEDNRVHQPYIRSFYGH